MSCSVAISSSAYRHGGATNLEHDSLQWHKSPAETYAESAQPLTNTKRCRISIAEAVITKGIPTGVGIVRVMASANKKANSYEDSVLGHQLRFL
ncbi:MAG: hypothetical protein APF81_26770 [Desulfosporosinus sp. BRH_c37]|nr:MAG: hypothetical protein APF81_26770 [Desulfosporosinus sp. BRH_c37]